MNIIQSIKFIYRTSYGHSRYYPGCNLSNMICQLMERATLSKKELDLIKEYGFNVSIEKEGTYE